VPVVCNAMGLQWLGIMRGHGGRDAERALTADGFKCTRQKLHPSAELKVLIRDETPDRERVEALLYKVNGKVPSFGVPAVPTRSFPGYREGP
jgi:hypothetical protein